MRAGVHLVLDQVMQLEHLDDADGDGRIVGDAGLAVVEALLAGGGQRPADGPAERRLRLRARAAEASIARRHDDPETA